MENNPLHHEIEQVDMVITRILNTARKKVKRIIRHNVPYSKGKEIRRSEVLCLKTVIILKRGIVVDDGIVEKKKHFRNGRCDRRNECRSKITIKCSKMHGLKWSNLEKK